MYLNVCNWILTRRGKWRLALIALIAALAVTGIVGLVSPSPNLVSAAAVSPYTTSQAPLASPAQDTAPISTRAIGNFVAAHQANLSFQLGGRLVAYQVKEGDQVKQGDVLAALDTSLLQLQVNQAQAGLALAQARLAQAQNIGSPEQLAAANLALQEAKANYDKVAAGPTQDDLAGAKTNLDRAKSALDQAQAAYDKTGGASNPNSALLPTSKALQDATSGYQAAIAAWNLARNRPTPGELAGAASLLAQALSLVTQLTPTQENVAIARAGVAQAQVGLDLAKQNLANAALTAPFDGTVIMEIPHAGESVNSNATVLMLADLSMMQVQVNVDENTLSGLQVGQPTTMSVDALGGKTLTGKISKIGLLATSSGGIVTVPVTVDVDTGGANVYPGLSATVQFNPPP